MIKVLFVCLGNICRSPMAQFVLKQMVAQKGLADQFEIDSAATAIGNMMRKTAPCKKVNLSEQINFNH